jgi:hypothetical protein
MQKKIIALLLSFTIRSYALEFSVPVSEQSPFYDLRFSDELFQQVAQDLVFEQPLENAIRDLLAWRRVSRKFFEVQLTEKQIEGFKICTFSTPTITEEQQKALRRFATHCCFHGLAGERGQMRAICRVLRNLHWGVPLKLVVLTTEHDLPGTPHQIFVQFPFLEEPIHEFYSDTILLHTDEFKDRLGPLGLGPDVCAELRKIESVIRKFTKRPPELRGNEKVFSDNQYDEFSTLIWLCILQDIGDPSYVRALLIDEMLSPDEKELLSAVFEQSEEAVQVLVHSKPYSHYQKNAASFYAYLLKKEALALSLFTFPSENANEDFIEFAQKFLALALARCQTLGTALPVRLYQGILESIPTSGSQTDLIKAFMFHKDIIPLMHTPEKKALLDALMGLLKAHKSNVAQEIAQFIFCAYDNSAGGTRTLAMSKQCAHETEWNPFLRQASGALLLAARRANCAIIEEFAGAFPDSFFDTLIIQALTFCEHPEHIVPKLVELKAMSPQSRPVHGLVDVTNDIMWGIT